MIYSIIIRIQQVIAEIGCGCTICACMQEKQGSSKRVAPAARIGSLQVSLFGQQQQEWLAPSGSRGAGKNWRLIPCRQDGPGGRPLSDTEWKGIVGERDYITVCVCYTENEMREKVERDTRR
ncbi:hypothetical protein GOP47_0010932 [Adiantum capillus-veneris]|uniref:Uncharacterized protein n=1 Tax=Adiantum capillus-veneris TaxID=13818 RepID=A0A9D4UW24_ADICA|nr:hypothetical protein GOP47_0010932 [Adiantum capillus-veneris]